MARLQKKSRRQSPQDWPYSPAFPARWSSRLLRALPGDRAFLPPSSASSPTRHQRRGVGTTRLDRPHLIVRLRVPQAWSWPENRKCTFPDHARALRPDTATASHAPRSVTIARRPSHERGTARRIVLICPTTQAALGAANWHDGHFGHGWDAERPVERRWNRVLQNDVRIELGRRQPDRQLRDETRGARDAARFSSAGLQRQYAHARRTARSST